MIYSIVEVPIILTIALGAFALSPRSENY
jgi:hypothetical protein